MAAVPLLFPISLSAQHMHEMKSDSGSSMKMDEMKMNMDSMMMSSIYSMNLPMSRDGSGTSWQPDATPMEMYMAMGKKWQLMVHGNFFIRYTTQNFNNDSLRGNDAIDGPNWLMGMYSHKVGMKNLVSVSAMLSFDALTEGQDGYPLLLQTGESYKGQPLIDKQHPHDLFSQITVGFTRSFNKDIDLNLYLGYPGEPALGPSVFMHRASAMNDPDAPISHHWQDATHITFGVGTLGFRYKMVRVEGSIFTGREPNDNRYDFDSPTFDSYSYRINLNPNKNFALQFSQGFIKSPEELHPDEDVIRTTASVLHTTMLSEKNYIASSLVWGMNKPSGDDAMHSILLESNLQLNSTAIYGRYEFVQKSAEELEIPVEDNPAFNINDITLGVSQRLLSYMKTDLAIGVQSTLSVPQNDLKPFYGDMPLSVEFFFRIHPAMMKHSEMMKM